MKTRQKLTVIMLQFVVIIQFISCATTGQYHITENNQLDYSELVGETITVQIHRVLGPWYHASIRINLDTDALMEKYSHYDMVINTDENGVKYITIGAGPSGRFINRKLIAEFNRPRDSDEKNYIKVETHDFNLSSEEVVIILDAFKVYDNDLSYTYFPEMRRGRFNSNSFISGILNSVGLEAPKFSERYRIPGFYTPMPLSIQ